MLHQTFMWQYSIIVLAIQLLNIVLFFFQPAEKQLAATTTDLATNNPMRLLPIVAVLIAIVLLLVILAVIFVIIIRGRNGCANTASSGSSGNNGYGTAILSTTRPKNTLVPELESAT